MQAYLDLYHYRGSMYTNAVHGLQCRVTRTLASATTVEYGYYGTECTIHDVIMHHHGLYPAIPQKLHTTDITKV